MSGRSYVSQPSHPPPRGAPRSPCLRRRSRPRRAPARKRANRVKRRRNGDCFDLANMAVWHLYLLGFVAGIDTALSHDCILVVRALEGNKYHWIQQDMASGEQKKEKQERHFGSKNAREKQFSIIERVDDHTIVPTINTSPTSAHIPSPSPNPPALPSVASL